MPQILLNLSETSRQRVFGDGEALARLAALGAVVSFDPKSDDPAAFPGLLAASDVMITSWGSQKLTPDLVAGRDRPLLVAHGAGSIRSLVPKAVMEQGVRVSQSTVPIAVAVAQFTVGMMIMALRQSLARLVSLRAGSGVQYGGAYPCFDLEGLTVGLVGLSQVGLRVPPLLAPFGCHVIAYDPYARPEQAAALGVELVADLDDLIRRSDALSLHAPVTPETQNMIDARRVALIKPGAAVVNTARAAIADQDALFTRALAGEIQVYVDVTTPEPLPPTHEAWSSPNIFITPHIAGLSQQALRRIARHVVEEVERYLSGQPLAHEVTLDRYDILG